MLIYLLYLLTSWALCTLVWLFYRWTQVRKYWAVRNVPFIKPHPLLGNLDRVFRSNPADWMLEIWDETKRSPYSGVWFLWRPALVVNCADIAKRILIKDSDAFRDHFFAAGENDPTGSLNLFFLREPKWSIVRRHLSPVFTSAKLKILQDLAATKSKELVQRIHQEVAKNEFIDIKKMYADFSTDIIGTASLGIENNSTLTGDGPLRRVTDELSRFDFRRNLAWFCIFNLPQLVDIFGFTFLAKSTVKYFAKIFNRAVELRGGFERAPDVNKDLLDALIRMKFDAAKNNEDINDDFLLAQAMIFLLGGYETTALNLTYLSVEVANNPLVQEKLYQELYDAKMKYGDLDAQILSELKYLNCCINETLRKYPPTPFLDRVASRDYRIDEVLTIKAGTQVIINMYSMHYNPKYHPDPEEFKPERFMDECVFLPFGDGPRMCIGSRFAYQQIRYAAASIVLNFELRPRTGCPRPADFKYAKHAAIMLPAQTLSVQFVPRKL